jgi:RNA polymerase sigma-70 factor (ECF subfamily)
MNRDDAAEKAQSIRQRLVEYVNRRLGPAMKKRLDPEDIVQSAMKSFFGLGQMPDSDRELEDLLFHFTKWKLGKSLRYHLAQKRSPLAEAPQPRGGEERFGAEWEPESRTVDPAEEAVWKEMEGLRDCWWKGLSDAQRQVLELKEQGLSLCDIAVRVGRTERTVSRYREEAKEKLRACLDLGEPPRDPDGDRGGQSGELRSVF